MYWCISEKCVVNTNAFCEGIVEGTIIFFNFQFLWKGTELLKAK